MMSSRRPAKRKRMVPGGKPSRKVAIVDEHPLIRLGLKHLLSAQPGLMVWWEAGRPADALEMLGCRGTDLLITGLIMSGRSGLDFVRDVRSLLPSLPVLVVSMHNEMIFAERALRAGARGYVMKSEAAEIVMTAVRRVLAGKIYVSPRVMGQMLAQVSGTPAHNSHSPFATLTDREFEVFGAIGQGKTSREVARQLGICQKTVEVHLLRIKHKLGLTSLVSLVSYAARWLASGLKDDAERAWG